MKIFLDDERSAPPGWTLIKSVSETIDQLKTGKVTDLSLDHDLGDAKDAYLEDRKEITGYNVLQWLDEQVTCHNFKAPKNIQVHSANASAHQKMIQAIERIKRG